MGEYNELVTNAFQGNSTATSITTLVIAILSIIALWKIFEKAGEAGWKAIIPFYNAYTLVKIVDGSGIKFLLFLIPFVNIVYYIIFNVRLAKVFGKGTGFAIGLMLLPNLFTLILGFGNDNYLGTYQK